LPSGRPLSALFFLFFHQAENLLHQLQENFQALTEKITLRNILFGAGRIDDLEKHVADLMTEAGVENTDEELRV
ncbi:HSBPL protein, partial [Balaeniceps rex]|nr:HSBPL protein [Balaeniceps rex]